MASTPLPAGKCFRGADFGSNAALIAGVAIGNSEWRFASVAFILGLLVQIVAATGIVLGVFVVCLLALILVSTWLMVEGHPVISVLVALCAFPLTAASDRWSMARARHMA